MGVCMLFMAGQTTEPKFTQIGQNKIGNHFLNIKIWQ